MQCWSRRLRAMQKFSLHAPGPDNMSNALAAAGAGVCDRQSRCPRSSPVSRLFAPLPDVSRRCTRPAVFTVIDDSYNANPDSVRAAIDVLAAAPSPRWLVLGDMGEVGAGGPQFHHEVGAYARAAGIDRLLTVGTLTASSAAAFGAAAAQFTFIEELIADLAASARPGTTILVKARA
jgi:UDP-N-acetylmuramoyl-tripeptide--D-alanyl-D-alanine ligase